MVAAFSASVTGVHEIPLGQRLSRRALRNRCAVSNCSRASRSSVFGSTSSEVGRLPAPAGRACGAPSRSAWPPAPVGDGWLRRRRWRCLGGRRRLELLRLGLGGRPREAGRAAAATAGFAGSSAGGRRGLSWRIRRRRRNHPRRRGGGRGERRRLGNVCASRPAHATAPGPPAPRQRDYRLSSARTRTLWLRKVGPCQRRTHLHPGQQHRKVVPCPSTDRTSISPPCSCTVR